MNISNPNDWENPCNRCHYNISDYDIGYNKAIDDFINACKEDILCQTFGLHTNGIERIAEQLKKEVEE